MSGTDPALSVVPLASAKAWIGLDPADTSKDDILTSCIAAAVSECWKIIGRNPLQQTFSEIVSAPGGAALPLNQHPVTAVTSVTIDPQLASGGLLLPASSYVVDENAIYLLDRLFPRGRMNVAVVYQAGFATLPADIMLAIQFTIKAFWDARLTDMNSTGESWSDVGGSTFWPSGPGSVPPQAMAKISLYIDYIKA